MTETILQAFTDELEKIGQYKKSVRGGDCKHIKSLKQSGMMRKEGSWDRLLTKPVPTFGNVYLKAKKARKSWETGKAVAEADRQLTEQGRAQRGMR